MTKMSAKTVGMMILTGTILIGLLNGCAPDPQARLDEVLVAPQTWQDPGEVQIVRILTDNYGAMPSSPELADLIIKKMKVDSVWAYHVIRADGVVIDLDDNYPYDLARRVVISYRAAFPAGSGQRPERDNEALRVNWDVKLVPQVPITSSD